MADPRRALIDPQITINNETIQIVPNSGELILGIGEDSVETVSAGNGETDIVTGTDVSTKKSKLTIGVKNTEVNMLLIPGFKLLRGNLTVSISEGTFNKTLRNATIINDPTFAFTNDSNVSVEIEGRTAR